MKTQGVVLSLAVADAERCLDFYRDVVGIKTAALSMGSVCLDLPGMMVFLVEPEAFGKYSGEASRIPLRPVPVTSALLSCALASVAEVNEVLHAVETSSGKVFAAHEIQHVSGLLQ